MESEKDLLEAAEPNNRETENDCSRATAKYFETKYVNYYHNQLSPYEIKGPRCARRQIETGKVVNISEMPSISYVHIIIIVKHHSLLPRLLST